MASPTRRRLLAAALSMIARGAGQVYAGARRRGIVFLAVAAALVAAAVATAAVAPAPSLDRGLLALVLAVDLAVLAFRLFAVVDAWRTGGAVTAAAAAGLAALAALTAAPHVGAAYVSVRSYGVLEHVFADEAPHDVLPSRGVFLAPRRPSPGDPLP